MNREVCILVLCSGSLISGVIFVRILLRQARLLKNTDNTFALKIPFLGELPLNTLPKEKGIVVDEYLDLKENAERLAKYLDLDLILRYARQFKINYIGTEGDLEDGSWSPGRLASCTMSNSFKGGYNLYFNPDLDVDQVSSMLSKEMDTTITADEVYPFLFLHEIGHTTTAGNQNFYTAVVNYALSGGRRSTKRRKELNKLKSSIESFADSFARDELEKWRKGKASKNGFD